MTIKPYTAYKRTNLAWLPQVPEHWDICKTKYLFKLITEQAEPNNDYELLSVYTDIGVKPRKELEERGNKASTTDSYWIVKKGDIVVNKLLAWMCAMGISEYDGVTSPAYDVLRPIKGKTNPKFYNYLFRCGILSDEFRGRSRGIMDMRLRLYFNEFGQIFLPLPSYQDQTNIVDFLDHKTTQIDTAIAKKQQLIELLKEQKQAMINKAVTEGLNGKTDHWERKKLKYVVRNTSHQTDKLTTEDVYVGMENIESKTGKYLITTEKIVLESQGKKFANDQILFGKLRPYLAKVWLAEFSGVCSGEFLTFSVSKQNIPKFIQLRLLTKSFIDIVDGSTYGTKMPRADWGFIGNQFISIPTLAEQAAIVAHIERESQQTDTTISRIEREIELLKEYRTTLIANAVTGSIKVI